MCSIDIDTSERMISGWYPGYVVGTTVVQSTVVCEGKRTIRGHSYNKYITKL